jgi:hypothetical protein
VLDLGFNRDETHPYELAISRDRVLSGGTENWFSRAFGESKQIASIAALRYGAANINDRF